MWDVSDEFLALTKKSHRMSVRCEVYSDGVYVQDLIIHEGQVRMDYNAEIQRTCSLTLADPLGDLTPDDMSDLLAVAGNEIKVYRGLYLNDGTLEEVPLGVFDISSTDITESGDSHTIQIMGYDRSRAVSRNKFTQPYVIAEGTTYTDAIRSLILSRFPAALFEQDNMPYTTPQIIFDVDRDPWKAAMSLAKDQGCDLSFNGDGVVVCTPTPDPATMESVDNYHEGDDCTMLSISKRWNDEEIVNYWIVTGESTNDEPPVSAEAKDTDPASPTYIYGPHGIHLKRYKSNTVNTTDQAQQVANALLYQSLGSYETLRFSAIPNPALELNDVIHIERARIGVAARYVLDKISIPLTAQRGSEYTVRQR